MLIVTEDSVFRQELIHTLDITGCTLLCSSDADDAFNILNTRYIEIVLLDLSFQHGQVPRICQKMLQDCKHPLEVILLSKESSLEDIVLGFEYGAADVVTGLHLQPSILVARIRQAAKRLASQPTSIAEEPEIDEKIIRCGPLVLLPSRYAAYVRNRRLVLTAREFQVLAYLASRPSRVIPRSSLAQSCIQHLQDASDRMIDNLISRLRKKLGDDAALIESVRGVGYRLSVT